MPTPPPTTWPPCWPSIPSSRVPTSSACSWRGRATQVGGARAAALLFAPCATTSSVHNRQQPPSRHAARARPGHTRLLVAPMPPPALHRAGHTVPLLAQAVLQHNAKAGNGTSGTTRIPLQGIAVGNPWVDPEADNKGGRSCWLGVLQRVHAQPQECSAWPATLAGAADPRASRPPKGATLCDLQTLTAVVSSAASQPPGIPFCPAAMVQFWFSEGLISSATYQGLLAKCEMRHTGAPLLHCMAPPICPHACLSASPATCLPAAAGARLWSSHLAHMGCRLSAHHLRCPRLPPSCGSCPRLHARLVLTAPSCWCASHLQRCGAPRAPATSPGSARRSGKACLDSFSERLEGRSAQHPVAADAAPPVLLMQPHRFHHTQPSHPLLPPTPHAATMPSARRLLWTSTAPARPSACCSSRSTCRR